MKIDVENPQVVLEDILTRMNKGEIVERKKGEWITKVLNYGDRGLKDIYYECSVCNMDFSDKWNYCPYCGADMREEKTDD